MNNLNVSQTKEMPKTPSKTSSKKPPSKVSVSRSSRRSHTNSKIDRDSNPENEIKKNTKGSNSSHVQENQEPIIYEPPSSSIKPPLTNLNTKKMSRTASKKPTIKDDNKSTKSKKPESKTIAKSISPKQNFQGNQDSSTINEMDKKTKKLINDLQPTEKDKEEFKEATINTNKENENKSLFNKKSKNPTRKPSKTTMVNKDNKESDKKKVIILKCDNDEIDKKTHKSNKTKKTKKTTRTKSHAPKSTLTVKDIKAKESSKKENSVKGSKTDKNEDVKKEKNEYCDARKCYCLKCVDYCNYWNNKELEKYQIDKLITEPNRVFYTYYLNSNPSRNDFEYDGYNSTNFNSNNQYNLNYDYTNTINRDEEPRSTYYLTTIV